MKFILGKKQNMTQFFTEDGKCLSATLLSVDPVVVTQVKSTDKDGYVAVQVGYGKRNSKNIHKAQKGHTKDLGEFAYFKEFRIAADSIDKFKKGDVIDVSTFAEGDVIRVSGTSKGKGFQGVVKRHGFSGGPRSHGQKHSEREPGSIGATGPQRVFKGVRMAGRMGGDRITLKNLKVLGIDKENGMMLISGAVPGRRGTVIEIVG